MLATYPPKHHVKDKIDGIPDKIGWQQPQTGNYMSKVGNNFFNGIIPNPKT